MEPRPSEEVGPLGQAPHGGVVAVGRRGLSELVNKTLIFQFCPRFGCLRCLAVLGRRPWRLSALVNKTLIFRFCPRFGCLRCLAALGRRPWRLSKLVNRTSIFQFQPPIAVFC